MGLIQFMTVKTTERRSVGVPGFTRKKLWIFSFSSRGEGEVSSRVELEMGGWFRPLPRGTRQAKERGRGPRGGECGGGGGGGGEKRGKRRIYIEKKGD